MSNMSRIKRIKGKYYDTGTRNTSFLQVAKDLQRLGIKNYYFMLEIYDYTLVDVDPYSPNLTKEQVSEIYESEEFWSSVKPNEI